MPLQPSTIYSCPWQMSQSAFFSSKTFCVVIFWYSLFQALRKPLLSPVSSRFTFVFPLSQFSGPNYLVAWNRLILIGNRVRVKSLGMALGLTNARSPGSAKFANAPSPGLTRRANSPQQPGGDGGGGRRWNWLMHYFCLRIGDWFASVGTWKNTWVNACLNAGQAY